MELVMAWLQIQWWYFFVLISMPVFLLWQYGDIGPAFWQSDSKIILEITEKNVFLLI